MFSQANILWIIVRSILDCLLVLPLVSMVHKLLSGRPSFVSAPATCRNLYIIFFNLHWFRQFYGHVYISIFWFYPSIWFLMHQIQYGLDTSEFSYNPSESHRFQQVSVQPTEERSRCTIMWQVCGSWFLWIDFLDKGVRVLLFEC